MEPIEEVPLKGLGVSEIEISAWFNAPQRHRWRCRLTQVDLYNGHKTVVVIVYLSHFDTLPASESQAGIVLKRPEDRAGFWHGDFIHAILHYRTRIFGYLKYKDMPTCLWNFAPNSKLRKCPHASRSCCQQNSSTFERVVHTYTTADASWLFCTSIDRYAPTPLLRLVVDLLYKVIQLCSS